MNTTKRIGFQEPTYRAHPGLALDVTKATRLQLSEWYDEPAKFLDREGYLVDDDTSLRAATGKFGHVNRLIIRGFRAEIRRELKARNEVAVSRRRIEHRASRQVFIITPPIEKIRGLIASTRKPSILD